MVARAGGYYGPIFKGYHGVAQVDPLYHTIFNGVMGTVIYHWVTVVAVTESGMQGLGLSIQDFTAYLYKDDELVSSNQPERLQQAFGILADLFDWVRLRKKTRKTVSMACQPCHTPERMLVVAYGRHTTGMGIAYRERQKMQVKFLECGVEVAAGLLIMKHKSQHSVGRGTPPTGK